ncbi:hypothetical protein EDB92DRAFT_1981522 [Lactarius akahatsu]|uniref:NACHT domain-containing protein n=1 Tax=Lactarius akahatsu TaxID=416441 RepID=A0AAD4L6R7_9AGAM|nr:hypothetical protein EDB92DRAFT_1981522 [Lactarius akahatsu]
MSQAPSTSTSSSNFQSIFNAALKAYEKKTKKDLLAHPLAAQLQACNSPADILLVLQDKVKELDQSRSADERLSRWLESDYRRPLRFLRNTWRRCWDSYSRPQRSSSLVLASSSLAAKDVEAGQDALIDLFERIENFFKRLESYTAVRPTDIMMDMIIKIMIEVLNIFAIATKEMKQSRAKKYLRKLVGKKEIEDALKRLDTLTQEEARMAAAEILRLTHIITNDGKETKQVVQQLASSGINPERVLREWVFPPDPSTNHNIACDLHHGGTAQWFFQGSMFDEWKSTGSLLWIYGKPGSGKTILCSAIVQDIAALSEVGLASMAYFYFDFRDLDKQHIRNLLPSLLIQLSAQSDRRRDILSRLYLAHDNGEKKPRVGVMTQCLRDMLTIPDQRPIYIILDALDECPNLSGIPSPREQVVGLVKDLVNLRLPHLHICVTSRPEFDIRATLGPLALRNVSLHDQSGQKKDIVDYVHSVVYSDSETMMKRWRNEDKKMVVEALSEKADGMFRWVFCQLDTLRQCLPQCVRRTLNELPETLDETYERVVMEIKKANQAHAYRMLQCLTVAVRPLSVAELAELLAFNFDVAKGGIPELNSEWRWEDHEQAVLSTCSSLITVVPDYRSPVVQFSHFSVKEFLMSDRLATSTGDISQYHISLEDAHTVLARACLGVLLRDPNVENDANSAPLARYAAEHWVTHARVENVASRVREGVEQLFDPDQPYFEAWVQLHDVDAESPDPPNLADMKSGARPLYYAALCGLHELVDHLTLEYRQYTSARGGLLGTALHSASYAGHLQIVRSFLGNGVDVDVRDHWNGSPLQWASFMGHCDIVQCLLDHGADVNLQDDFHETPLILAAHDGHLDVVRVLLEHNANVHSRGMDGQTPLQRAIRGASHTPKGDYPQIMQLLLEHGADVDVEDKDGQTS